MHAYGSLADRVDVGQVCGFDLQLEDAETSLALLSISLSNVTTAHG